MLPDFTGIDSKTLKEAFKLFGPNGEYWVQSYYVKPKWFKGKKVSEKPEPGYKGKPCFCGEGAIYATLDRPDIKTLQGLRKYVIEQTEWDENEYGDKKYWYEQVDQENIAVPQTNDKSRKFLDNLVSTIEPVDREGDTYHNIPDFNDRVTWREFKAYWLKAIIRAEELEAQQR